VVAASEERGPRWRRAGPLLPLVASLIAGVAVYAPALRSGFVSDDYVYLYSVRSLSFSHYLRVSLVPNAYDSTLVLPEQFWRPLYFLSFQPMERLFGGHALLYHLVNLCIHLVTIVMVWLLAQKLTGRWQAASVSAAIFAVHPAGVASIAWVSSVNSVALPLGLASWLLFVMALERAPAEPVRWRLISWSVVLMAVGLLMRETAAVALAGLGLWYVFVPARPQLQRRRTYLALVPYVALILAYALLRTSFLTVSPEGSAPIRFGSQIPGHMWYYWKLALFPVHGSATWSSALRTAGAFIVLGMLAGAVLLRRWLVVALLLAFLVSAVPYSTLSFGVLERYFYFPAALFALSCGAVMAELQAATLLGLRPVALNAALVAATVTLLFAGGYVANGRVQTWVATNPKVSNDWVGQLRAQYPTLPAGGTLYVANTPLLLALFHQVVVPPTVHFYYPDVGDVVGFNPYAGEHPVLGPNDRIFVFDSSK